jgi:hypothetical protein
MVRKEREGVVDPEDGEDAGEAVIEEDGGILGAAEFSCGDGGDDDAADDEEDINADIAVGEEAKVLGGEVSLFDAVQVGQYDEESGESATDLDANDSPGLLLGQLWQRVASVALLYQREE